LFSHYYLDGAAYGIEISSYCKDGEPIPTVPKFVQIYHAEFPQDYIAIAADVVEDSYIEKNGHNGLAPVRGTHLRNGKFYAICGPDQYFYFRDVFRALMGDVSDILYSVSSQGNSEENDFLEDFYAHVLMAAIVRVGC
jgi:hypothetical protein